VFFFFGVMGRVAVETSNVAAGVRGFCKVRLLMTLAMAGETTRAGLLTGPALERKYFGFVAAARHMVRSGPVAAFATLLRWSAQLV
jgi:hypothetical protein